MSSDKRIISKSQLKRGLSNLRVEMRHIVYMEMLAEYDEENVEHANRRISYVSKYAMMCRLAGGFGLEVETSPFRAMDKLRADGDIFIYDA